MSAFLFCIFGLLNSFTQSSLQDIILDSPELREESEYPTIDTPISTSSFAPIPSEDSVEARWHHFNGIQETLRGIYLQEQSTPLDRTVGIEKALEHLNAAHDLDPLNNWIKFNLALLSLRQGFYHLSRSQLNLIQTSNTFLQDKVLMLLAYSNEFEGKIKEAKRYFRLVKLGREIPYDDYEPNTTYYQRQPDHSYVDYREFMSDVIVFHEMYNQYLQLIEEFGIEDEFGSLRSEIRQGYFYINEGRQNIKEAGDFFVKNHYVVLQGIINPTEIKIIGRWFHWLRDNKMTKNAQTHSTLNTNTHLQRLTGQSDRLTWYYHSRLLSLHSRIAQDLLKPSYTFISYYTPVKDAVTARPFLQGHTDRDDNEYTSSIQVFNTDVEGNQADGWPIWVDLNQTLPVHSSWRVPPENNKHSVTLYQDDGDSILFRGRQHIHWRENMPENTNETLTFLLHYVDENFDFYDYKINRGGKDKLSPSTTTTTTTTTSKPTY